MNARDARQAAGRLGLIVGGEAIQSCLHFVLNVAFMHLMSRRDYGLFAIVFVIGGIGLSNIRALASIPVSVYVGRGRSPKAADFFDSVFAAGAVVTALVIAAIVAVALAVSTPSSALAGGGFVGLWCLRAHFRTAFFAAGRRTAAIFGDFAFATTGAIMCLQMFWNDTVTLGNAFLALATANVLGIFTMHLNARRMPRLRFDRGFRACYRHLGARLAWSFAGVTTTNLQAQGIVLLVAAFAGPAAYAPIAAMLVFFVPLRLFWSAVVSLMQPRFAAYAARGDFDRVWRACLNWSIAHGLSSLAYSVCLYMLTPLLNTPALEGSPVTQLCLLAAAANLFVALYHQPRAALEMVMQFRELTIVSTVAGICGLAAIALILWTTSSSWALAGAALGEAVAFFGFWLVLWLDARARGVFRDPAVASSVASARSQRVEFSVKSN